MKVVILIIFAAIVLVFVCAVYFANEDMAGEAGARLASEWLSRAAMEQDEERRKYMLEVADILTDADTVQEAVQVDLGAKEYLHIYE